VNISLLKAVVSLLVVSAMLAGSAILFFRARSLGSLLQLFGASCLLIAVLTHFCEALSLVPFMHWGRPGSAGHYLDFWSFAVGLTLLLLGYLFHAITRRNSQHI
jgi:hypothetical protein